MKIPDNFLIRISTNSSGRHNKYQLPRAIKALLENVPLEFSYAKSMYSGGRYATENKFKVKIIERKNYKNELLELVLKFEKIKN
jgi:hypothetical protein